MNKRLLLLATVCSLGIKQLVAQLPSLDTTVYKQWSRLGNTEFSYDGNWVIYSNSGDTLPVKHLVNTATGKETLLHRANNPAFFCNGQWLKYNVGDSLLLMRLKDGHTIYWNKSSFIQTGNTSSYISYTNRGNNQSRVVLWNITTNDSTVLNNTMRYTLYNKEGAVLYLQGKQLLCGPLKGKHTALFNGEVNGYSFDAKQQTGTFLSGNKLYAFNLKGTAPQLLLNFDDIQSPPGYRVTPREYEITPGTKQLVLDVMSTQRPANNNVRPNANAADLELWTWNERISQRKQRRGAYSRTMMDDAKFVYHLDSHKVVQIVPEYAGMLIAPQSPAFDYVFYTDAHPYEYNLDWKYDATVDIYQVNVHTGERELVIQNSKDYPQWSPNGSYALLYYSAKKQWLVWNSVSKRFVDISQTIPYTLYEEEHDIPAPASAYGIAGWLDNGNTAVLYDRYDLWAVDLSGQRPARCLTNGYGRLHKIAFRLQGADYGGLLNTSAPILLRSFNEHTKSKGLYKLEPSGKVGLLADEPDYSVRVLAVSGNGQSFLFARQSYTQYPDLWFSNNRFQQPRRLTNANPQQQQFQWGTARVFSWTNYEGKNNEGLLYLPHNYDSSKRNPVIVDFYEKHSADLHEYITPEYSTSTINIPTYVSNGYIVFRPDIHYTVGAPGESVYNAVVSGARALTAQGFADSTRMGVQGHSFSGFEVAYLLTRTSLFACANIGAGVVNFTYNYTFVRSNGAPGLFKFEVEQYRMGKTLWEDPQGYINNSPIFKADKITTPVVILHNDKDGAVPFTQGLDLFLAMRRLQKPAWLLNYKGQNHTLEESIPQQDWTLRMRQFFDHYLKNAPMPRWMKEGISVDERRTDPKFN
jgi:dipeptidyl aminopeptidase/acylaminoacyl peptidase